MPNLIEISDQLKGMPDAFLQQQAQQPTGSVPPYLVLAELGRRQAMRKQQTAPPATTVFDDLTRPPGPPPGAPNPMATIAQLGAPPQGGTPATAPPGMAPPPQGPPPGMPPGMPPMGMGALAQRMPMPQGPPIGMASGGVVRLAGGGLGIDESEEEYWARKRREELAQLAAEPRHFAPPTGPFPERPPVDRTIRGVQFDPFPTLQIPNYMPGERIKVTEPELAPILKQVRELRGTVTPATQPLEQRIRELEEERTNIRGPRWGSTLLETGLAMMGSNAIHPGQALGQAGLGAARSWREQDRYAQERRQLIADRLAGLRTQSAEQAQRAVDRDLSLASDIQQRLHGKAVTEAQGEMAQRADEQRARLAGVATYNQQLTGAYEANQRFGIAKVNAMPKPYEPLTAAQKADFEYKEGLEHANRMEEIRENNRNARIIAGMRHSGDGYGNPFKTEGAIDDYARALIEQQFKLTPINDKFANPESTEFDAQRTYSEMKRRAAENVLNDKNYRSMNPAARQRVWASIMQQKADEDYQLAIPSKFGAPRDYSKKDYVQEKTFEPPIPDELRGPGGGRDLDAPSAFRIDTNTGAVDALGQPAAGGVPAAVQATRESGVPLSRFGRFGPNWMPPTPQVMLPENVTLYAEKHGISREEAIRRLRAEGWTVPSWSPSFGSAMPRGTTFGRGGIEGR